MATKQPSLTSGSLLLSLPPEIAEDIFIRVLDWIDIGLLLSINQRHFKRPPNQEDYYGTGSTIIRNCTRGRSTAELRAYLTHCTIPCQTRSHAGTLTFIERSDSAKYWTFSSLLRTCRQIRLQVGELFWRRQQLKVTVGLGRGVVQDLWPVLSPCLKPPPFGTGWSNQPWLHIRNLDLEIQISTSFFSCDYEISTTSRRPSEAMEQILRTLPNLRHLTLAFATGHALGGELAYFCVLDQLLRSLETFEDLFENLQSVHLKGKDYQRRISGETWGPESSGEVEETRSTAYAKTGFTLEGLYFGSLKQMAGYVSDKADRWSSPGMDDHRN